MANKTRRCKGCKDYKPVDGGIHVPLGWFCSGECASDWAWDKEQKKRAKAITKQKEKERIADREKKEALRDRRWHLKKAQEWFNRYIRLRDRDLPCISCGRHHGGQYHAGHYLTTAARPHLRYDESNCHKQCAPCNNHLSGNLVNYRISLIEKIGLEEVERLENDHNDNRFSIDDLKELIEKYKSKCKGIEDGPN